MARVDRISDARRLGDPHGAQPNELRMTLDISDLSPELAAHLRAECDEIAAIYGVLRPDCAIWADLWWERAPIDAPIFRPLEESAQPIAYGAGYLGRVRLQKDPGLGHPPMRIDTVVPRPLRPSDMNEGYRPWRERKFIERFGFAVSPMLFEHVIHQEERAGERKRRKVHSFDKLRFSRQVVFHPDKGELAAAVAGVPIEPRDPAILIGFHWLEVGGAESLAFDSVEWALDSGLRVFVISDRDGPQRLASRLPQSDRVRFLRTDRHLPRPLHRAYLSKLAARENIRLTHNHHCSILYDCLPALRTAAPWVRHIDSTHIIEYKDGGFPRKSGVWSNFLDLHHVISDDLRDFLQQGFLAQGRVRLGRLLDPARRDAAPLPARIRAGQKTCRVGFVGRMVHQKRPIVATEVARRLVRWGRRNGVDFQFDFVGEGEYREAVRMMLSRYGLQGHLNLHPASTNVPALLSKCDVVLMPSANEGLALVCYEAIEQGCLPISSDVGAQREIVPAGLLVPREPFRAAAGMVRAAIRLLTEPGFAESCAAEATERLRDLSNSPSAEEVLRPIYRAAAQKDDGAALDEVLSGRPAPAAASVLAEAAMSPGAACATPVAAMGKGA